MGKIIILFLVFMNLMYGCSQSNSKIFTQLPRKDWLESHTGSSKFSQNQPQYDSKKTYAFQDMVYLAVQQSPAISRSSVNLDIQKIALADARWKAIPEVHLIYTVSNNVTQYNKSKASDPRYKASMKDYGDTAYQLSFSGYFNNPVATYFDVQAQKELMAIAMATHKNVIGSYINEMAGLLVQMAAKRESIAVLEEFVALQHKNMRYYKAREQQHTEIWNSSASREDAVRDMELQLDTAGMELAMLRNQLKLLLGVDRDMRLEVDEGSIDKELENFDPSRLNWEQSWEQSTERYLLAQQVRLHDAGIMLAWAQYVPNISFVVNESAPKGQSQPTNAETDQFLHITFNFPLLDWGHRYRNAEQSRARKRQSRLDEITKRQEYRQNWFTASDRLTLSNARLKQREHAVQTAERRVKALSVAFGEGLAPFPELAAAQQSLLDARLAAITARAAVKQDTLAWMRLAQTLQNKFLNSAVTEGK